MKDERLGRIHSLDGDLDTVTVLEEKRGYYIVDYKGKKCTAIFNVFAGCLYVDDIYGVIKEAV